MTRVWCIGECMVELRPIGDGLLARDFAGDAYNTAAYLKRSAPELEVQFVSVTGADPLSAAMRAAWTAEGVGDAFAWTAPGKQPGLYLIETDPGGERRFRYWRSESAAKGWLEALIAHGGANLFAEGDLVYLSGISLAILPETARAAALELMRRLKGRVRLAFDPNYRPALWSGESQARRVMAEAIAAADVVLPSQEDLERLYGEADPEAQARRLTAWGVAEGAITAGPGRCLLVGGGWVHGAVATHVIDTSGAGDSFNGAYLAARLRGETPETAAICGLALAAEVVGAPGAVVPGARA